MKKITIILSIVILLTLLGSSVDIFGFTFSTRYYDSTIVAYNIENSEKRLVSEVATATIDDICVILGITEDNEYIITPFKVKNGKYFSLSHWDLIYDINNIGDELGEDFYHFSGKKVYYNLIKTDDIETYKKQYSNIVFSEHIKFNVSTSYVIAVYYK